MPLSEIHRKYAQPKHQQRGNIQFGVSGHAGVSVHVSLGLLVGLGRICGEQY